MLRFFAIISFQIFFLTEVFAQSSPLGSPIGHTFEPNSAYGGKVLSELQQKFTLVSNHPKAAPLERALHKISDCQKFPAATPWRLYIFDDDTVLHASAVPGNYLFAWTGILNALSEEEVQAVVVHLVAHVMAGHVGADPEIEAEKLLLETTSQMARVVTGRRGVGRIATDGFSNIGQAILRRKTRRSEGYYYFSERQEQEADALGVRIALSCGLNPKDNLFLFMRSENDRAFAERFKFFKKHQAYPGRLEKLGKLVEENPVSSAEDENRYPPVGKKPSQVGDVDTFDMSVR